MRLGGLRTSVILAVHDGVHSHIYSPGLGATANHLRKHNVQLADRNIRSDVLTNVQIIIGVDYLHRFIKGVWSKRGVQLWDTPGGAVVHGPLPRWAVRNAFQGDAPDDVLSQSVLCSHIAVTPAPNLSQLPQVGLGDKIQTPAVNFASEFKSPSSACTRGKFNNNVFCSTATRSASKFVFVSSQTTDISKIEPLIKSSILVFVTKCPLPSIVSSVFNSIGLVTPVTPSLRQCTHAEPRNNALLSLDFQSRTVESQFSRVACVNECPVVILYKFYFACQKAYATVIYILCAFARGSDPPQFILSQLNIVNFVVNKIYVSSPLLPHFYLSVFKFKSQSTQISQSFSKVINNVKMLLKPVPRFAEPLDYSKPATCVLALSWSSEEGMVMVHSRLMEDPEFKASQTSRLAISTLQIQQRNQHCLDSPKKILCDILFITNVSHVPHSNSSKKWQKKEERRPHGRPPEETPVATLATPPTTTTHQASPRTLSMFHPRKHQRFKISSPTVKKEVQAFKRPLIVQQALPPAQRSPATAQF